MSIRKTFTAILLAAGIALTIAVPEPAYARHRKVVVKHKRKHHRHVVGLKHIGRGTKHKTTVKTSH
jgi:hypothetical protein